MVVPFVVQQKDVDLFDSLDDLLVSSDESQSSAQQHQQHQSKLRSTSSSTTKCITPKSPRKTKRRSLRENSSFLSSCGTLPEESVGEVDESLMMKALLSPRSPTSGSGSKATIRRRSYQGRRRSSGSSSSNSTMSSSSSSMCSKTFGSAFEDESNNNSNDDDAVHRRPSDSSYLHHSNGRRSSTCSNSSITSDSTCPTDADADVEDSSFASFAGDSVMVSPRPQSRRLQILNGTLISKRIIQVDEEHSSSCSSSEMDDPSNLNPSLPPPPPLGNHMIITPSNNKQVKFSSSVLVRPIEYASCLCLEEKENVWYSSSELSQIKQEAQKLIRDAKTAKAVILKSQAKDKKKKKKLLLVGRTKKSSEVERDDNNNTGSHKNIHSLPLVYQTSELRGLHMSHKKQRRHQIAMAHQSVLEEQARIRRESIVTTGATTTRSSESATEAAAEQISKLYQSFTFAAVQIAIQIAKEDAAAATAASDTQKKQ